MVAKITSGVSVYGALYYNQEKVDKGKARTLAWNRIMERPDGTAGIPECMRSFEAYLAANLRTEKPVIHLSLNPHRVVQAAGFHQFDVDQIRCAAFQNADRVGRSKDTFIGQNRRVDALGDIAHALQIARFDGLLHELCVKIRIFQH